MKALLHINQNKSLFCFETLFWIFQQKKCSSFLMGSLCIGNVGDKASWLGDQGLDRAFDRRGSLTSRWTSRKHWGCISDFWMSSNTVTPTSAFHPSLQKVAGDSLTQISYLGATFGGKTLTPCMHSPYSQVKREWFASKAKTGLKFTFFFIISRRHINERGP